MLLPAPTSNCSIDFCTQHPHLWRMMQLVHSCPVNCTIHSCSSVLTPTSMLLLPLLLLLRCSSQDNDDGLNKAVKWTWITGGVLTLVLVVVWPLLALPAGVFSLGYFTMWVIISLIWGFAATAICLIMPWWESREHIGKILKGVFSGAAFKKTPKPTTDPAMAQFK